MLHIKRMKVIIAEDKMEEAHWFNSIYNIILKIYLWWIQEGPFLKCALYLM